MKRSRTVSLVVMGLTPLFISACDSTQKSREEFTSVDACTQAGVPAASCQAAYDRAETESLTDAPHFNTMQDCAAQYEDVTCDENTDGNDNSFWMPHMNGFLIARVIHQGLTTYFPAGPVFRKRDLSDYSPRFGGIYASNGGGSWGKVPSDEIAGEGDTVSRGGFGGDEAHFHS
jgi:uncharacterized protein YgiB involved in biofilm formation